MNGRFGLVCADLKLICHRRNIRRMSLNGRALHKVQNAAHSAHFFATTCPARAAMYQCCQWRTMPGAFLGRCPVKNVNAPMECARFEYVLAHNFRVVGTDGTHERAFAHVGQLDGFLKG